MFTGDNTGGGNVVLSLKTRAQDVACKELTDNERDVDPGRRGRDRPADRRDPGAWSRCRASTRTRWPATTRRRPRRRTTKLDEDKNKPLLNRALGETLPPGSTFKVIVSAAALQNGYTQETVIPAGSDLHRAGQRRADPQRRGRGLPGLQVTLKAALTESCNTGFAQLGVEARRRQGQGEGAGVRLRAGRPDRRQPRRRRPAGRGQPDRRDREPGRQHRPGRAGPVVDRAARRPDDAAAGRADRRHGGQRRQADAAVPGAAAARPGPHGRSTRPTRRRCARRSAARSPATCRT